MGSPSLRVAGRDIEDAEDLIRRYCGLPWSKGRPETWAFRFYDAVPVTDADFVDPIDVLACAALHPGLSRTDLEFFDRSSAAFDQWLADLPSDVPLHEAPFDVVDRVLGLLFLAGPVRLSLLSKVAHRKRPHLVPIFERTIADRYGAGSRLSGEQRWPDLVYGIQDDLRDGRNQVRLQPICASVNQDLVGDAPAALTPLRALDIAVWMEDVT